jgi:tetratricopeptide (TPR) repeat protein
MKDLEQLVGEADFIKARLLVRDLKAEFGTRIGVDDIEGLRFHCLAAEVLDHDGNYEEASRLAHKVGGQCVEMLKALTERPEPEDRSLWKQRAWAVLQSGFAHYRRGELKDALDRFRLIEKKIELLRAIEYPCWGLRARLAYAIGLVHRQRHEYFEAKQAFGAAVDLVYRRIAASRKSHQFYEWSAARALALGLGWIHYTEGSLSTAKALVNAARSLLPVKKPELIASYIEVLYACIAMSAESTDAAIVEEAIRQLTQAHGFFAKSGHKAYQARAANELALAFLRQAGNVVGRREELLAAAERSARQVEDFGKAQSQIRWQSNASVALSRLARARGQWPEAVACARRALDLAEANHIRFCEIDARIALGEALLGPVDDARGNPAEAAVVFGQALKQSRGRNSKDQSVIHLHLALCHLQMRQLGPAIWHFEQGQSEGRQNENAFVRRLNDKVSDRLSSERAAFVVPFDMDDPQARLISFQGWLTTWALARATQDGVDARNKVGRAAALLGIGVATFQRWRANAGLPPSDYRRTRRPRSEESGGSVHRSPFPLGSMEDLA